MINMRRLRLMRKQPTMKYLKLIYRFFAGPPSVDEALSSLTSTLSSLTVTAELQGDRAHELYIRSEQCRTESRRAYRVAQKLEELLK